MEIGEEQQARAQELIFGELRLFDFEHYRRAIPYGRGARSDLRAARSIIAIAKTAADSRAAFDDHRVTVMAQSGRTRRRNRDPPLIRFDLFRNTDDHINLRIPCRLTRTLTPRLMNSDARLHTILPNPIAWRRGGVNGGS